MEIAATGQGVVVARLSGDIDVSRIPDIHAAIAASMTGDTRCLVVDLSGVRYFDSSGIRLIFEVRRRLEPGRQRLGLVTPDGAPVRRVLMLVNMEEHVGVYPTVDGAVADLTGGEMRDPARR